jgi:hypothetical protein
MRFVKRRNPATRPAVKTASLIVFRNATQNWRERIKALKAAQEAQDSENCKGDTMLAKPDRP